LGGGAYNDKLCSKKVSIFLGLQGKKYSSETKEEYDRGRRKKEKMLLKMGASIINPKRGKEP